MEQLLRSLFDYQGFAGHPGLEAQIDETARDCPHEEPPCGSGGGIKQQT